MIRCVGSWPSTNAGRQTDAMIDFKDRGGRLTIRRVISPRRTRSSCQPIAFRCQPESKAWPGASVANAFSTKALKSRRRSACSRRASAAEVMIGVLHCVQSSLGGGRLFEIRQVAAQDRDVLGGEVLAFPRSLRSSRRSVRSIAAEAGGRGRRRATLRPRRAGGSLPVAARAERDRFR